MMLYRNMKVKVSSADGETDFFDIVAGVLWYLTKVPPDGLVWQKAIFR